MLRKTPKGSEYGLTISLISPKLCLVRLVILWESMKNSGKRKGPRVDASSRDPKNVRESWQIQSAKARFSEVFRRARTEGPQRITRQGKEGVVMLAEEQYERLVGKSHQPRDLVQFFRQSPFVGVELDLERDHDSGRDIDL